MSPLEIGALGASLGYICFLGAEALLLRQARRRVGLVIHVNGTRGKTETTRLIAAALRAGGRRTLAKTTGTLPLLILPDGSEKALRRLGSPNVREQRDLLLRAARLGAEALVAECMAVSPDAQAASTAFLRPSILVVTNSRPDHQDLLGSPAEAGLVFAAGLPKGGIAFTADPGLLGPLEAAARRVGAQAVLALPRELGPGIRAENAGLALAVALHLGVEESLALEGMAASRPDPGAFALRSLPGLGGGHIALADALAANDPVSTELLFKEAEARFQAGPGRGPRILLLVSRADRPERALAFAAWAAGVRPGWDRVLTLGPLPSRARRILGAAYPGPRLGRLGRIEDILSLEDGARVFACGNWKAAGPRLAGLGEKP